MKGQISGMTFRQEPRFLRIWEVFILRVGVDHRGFVAGDFGEHQTTISGAS
jgi:hypothetical protein